MSLAEVASLEEEYTIECLLYRSFYPAVWSGKNLSRLLYPNYIKTCLERDVWNLLAIRDLDLFQRFIRLCAARVGSVFVATELSNELVVTVNTVNSWISVLQASYILYMLPPFFTNTPKRLTKRHKLYFTESGIAAYLLDIDSPEIMNRDKMRGHLFENMVIMIFLKDRFNKWMNGGMYLYRDSNGNEVDLLVKNESRYCCYGIKSSATFHPDFTKGLANFEKNYPELVNDKSLIYTGTAMPDFDGIKILNYSNI